MLRGKSEFLILVQNHISVRAQKISKYSMNSSEIIIPKELIQLLFPFLFLSSIITTDSMLKKKIYIYMFLG